MIYLTLYLSVGLCWCLLSYGQNPELVSRMFEVDGVKAFMRGAAINLLGWPLALAFNFWLLRDERTREKFLSSFRRRYIDGEKWNQALKDPRDVEGAGGTLGPCSGPCCNPPPRLHPKITTWLPAVPGETCMDPNQAMRPCGRAAVITTTLTFENECAISWSSCEGCRPSITLGSDSGQVEGGVEIRPASEA